MDNFSEKKPTALSDNDLEGVVGGTTAVAGAAAATSVNMQNIQSMDIEAALMMVQSERTKMLDSQLQSQIQEVQNRNEQVSNLNNSIVALNTVAATFGTNDTASTKFSSDLTPEKKIELFTAVEKSLEAAGVTGFSAEMADKDLTKGEVEGMISGLKGMIDAAGNSQQMDMLRLQSLSNKRNEAFDVMTNFVKKMQESRSSIIGNMR